MTPPCILLADADPERRAALLEVLQARYGTDYDLIAAATSDEALQACAAVRGDGRQVALVIAPIVLQPLSGLEFLDRVREECPEAQLLLLLLWGVLKEPGPLVQAVSQGRLDHFVMYTGMRHDEGLHLAVTELLAEYGRRYGPRFEPVRVVGDPWAPRSHEFRDLLTRNGIPFGFYAADSDEGRALLSATGLDQPPRLPVVVLADGQTLADPSNAETARYLGGNLDFGAKPYDVTIVGAGPAGLAAGVYASSEGLRTLVIDREAIGGQAGTSSMIRNYLGFPRGISGGDLTMRAATQAQLFGARVGVIVEAVRLTPGDGLHTITLGDGAEILSRTVVIATGSPIARCRQRGSIASRAAASTTAPPSAKPRRWPAGTPTSSEAATAQARRPCTCPASPSWSRSWSAATRSPPPCPTTSSRSSNALGTSTCAIARKWPPVTVTATSPSWCSTRFGQIAGAITAVVAQLVLAVTLFATSCRRGRLSCPPRQSVTGRRRPAWRARRPRRRPCGRASAPRRCRARSGCHRTAGRSTPPPPAPGTGPPARGTGRT